jgi:hypothetical protein
MVEEVEDEERKMADRTTPRTLTKDYKKIIIIGEDGLYLLEEDQWKSYPMQDAADADAVANVNLLKVAGSYIAFLDPEIAAGAGMACTVVNLEAILREAKYRP